MNGWLLLTPAGLIALAALAIPLLIHLLSRSRGKRVLVGNIELFRQVQTQRASQIRLVQWLLLVLRVLLLLTAALLLADLARQGLAPPVENTAYITPARLAAAERGGAPIPDDQRQTRLVSLDGGWAQLSEALATQRHEGEVSVYTLASAADQPAEPLALPSPVIWQSAGAAAARAPSLLNVLLVHDPARLVDARALEAALLAVAQFRDLSVNVRLMPADTTALSETGVTAGDALIWLSEQPVPGDLQAAVQIDDSVADVVSPHEFVTVVEWPGLSFLAGGNTADQAPENEALWRDNAGLALLVEQHGAGQRRLRFTQRLAVEADNPVVQDGWPDMLARLLLGEAGWQSGTAHATLPAQETPLSSPLLTRGQPARSVVPLLSLLLALLFIAERWLAERPGKGADADD